MQKRPAPLREEADKYIRQCLSDSSPPHVNEFAERLGVSASRLSKEFLREVGERPAAYLKRQRITCAQQFLTTTNLTLEEIARRCGFGTATSFHRFFVRATGVTPGQFRDTRSSEPQQRA